MKDLEKALLEELTHPSTRSKGIDDAARKRFIELAVLGAQTFETDQGIAGGEVGFAIPGQMDVTKERSESARGKALRNAKALGRAVEVRASAGNGMVTVETVEMALKGLCPLWPFC